MVFVSYKLLTFFLTECTLEQLSCIYIVYIAHPFYIRSKSIHGRLEVFQVR